MAKLIACAGQGVELSGVPTEIKILPLGRVHSQKGDFTVDGESFDLIRKQFKDRKLDLVIDYEHQTLSDVQAPAGGWIKDLYKGEDAIIAKVEWTARAAEYLKNKEYRYLSPVVLVRKRDQKAAAIHSVALTNTPAIDGMFALVNSLGMVKERNYIAETLKGSGIKSQVYTNMKKLKQGNEVHVGAVLRNGETFTRSGSKRKFVDQEGRRKRRVKLWDRNTSLHVVIADTSEEKVEEILEAFLRNLKKGMDVDGNWVNIVVGEADWVEEGDSILKAKVAVQFDITFEGGIYEDRDIKPMDIGSVG